MLFRYDKLELSEDGFRAVAESGFISDKMITLKYEAFKLNWVDFGYEKVFTMRHIGTIVGFSNSRAFLEGKDVELWTM